MGAKLGALTLHPALARASWDWGYGDWETPIDAASHVGNRAIAEFLIANAVDAGDRRRAEEEVRKLGVDPRKVRSRKASKR